MIYISRSRIEAFQKCRRRYYYSYRYLGKGYDLAHRTNADNLELVIGIGVHKGLEILLLTLDIELAVQSAVNAYWEGAKDWNEDNPLLMSQREEGLALVEALVRAWALVRLPLFMEEYQVIAIEKEIEALLTPDITLVGRPDLVTLSLSDNSIMVWNWKTTKELKNWTSQWRYDMQMQTEALCVEKDLRVKVAGCIVEGLGKGSRREGLLNSPLIYGYHSKKGDKGLVQAGYKAGWEKFQVWRSPISIKDWLNNFVPPALMQEQFVRSEPILKNDSLVEKWIRQVVLKETTSSHMMESHIPEEDRLDHFDQVRGKYTCPYCPFVEVCDGLTSMEALIEEGRLGERVSPLNNRNELVMEEA